MSIKSITNGYEVDCRPQGRNGKRYRKKFTTKGEAQKYERWLLSTQNQKDWVEKTADKRPLIDLIHLWYHYHGQQLKTGPRELKHLITINADLGNLKADQLTRQRFMQYRADKMAGGMKPASINRNQTRLSSVFTALIKAEEFHNEHPFKGMGPLKVRAPEMGLLTKAEIKQLLASLSGDELHIAKLCLSTGARWSESAELKSSDIVHGRVIFGDTKNGRNRTVPITDELLNEISHGKSGRLFNGSYTLFLAILKQQQFDIPKGQASHVLRHSFASHFMMNGGNILTLQKILGHSTIMQTMTYSHLAPDYLNEAMKYNPVSTL
ncbi:tyrosine-type recombinase/integrase [Moritella sp. Urea-trap-13]|uniref:phage integrase n=1 Tax=Moritella sp. Urea-trap-13 TaxID=2058327 RepID=UPI000C3350C2|nr:tyrosine-type recombinase/integrase [Moritella sp. Urea-trap-13]PKH06434.1 integrase [Moritella sp. Urea-trap-13]